jgi:hypothetical protein
MAIRAPYVVVLYGSVARGTADGFSDRDVLVLSDGSNDRRFLAQTDRRLSVSTYRWSDFDTMHDYGSLFLQHLRSEGRILEGTNEGRDKYHRLLQSLPRYCRPVEDIRAFRRALDDVSSAIRHRDSTPEFELAALATVMRHSAILGCYLINQMDFGRYSAVRAFCHSRGLPEGMGEGFPFLYSFRMSLARSHPWPEGASYGVVGWWLRRARLLVREVEQCRNESAA